MHSSPMARLFGALLAAGIGLGPAAAQEGAAPPGVAVPAAVPPAPALAPDAVALKAALQAEMAELPADRRSAIDGFFAARGYAPFWTEPGSARPDELVAALEAADAQGLPRSRYAPDALALMFDTPGDQGAAAAREVAAMGAYLGLATDLSAGIVDPSGISPEISVDPTPPAASVLLARAGRCAGRGSTAGVRAGKPRLLPGSSPRRRGSRRCRRAKPGDRRCRKGRRCTRATAARGWRSCGPGWPGSATWSRPQSPLAKASTTAWRSRCRRSRSDYGLVDDGVVGSRTLAAVNAPVETRLAQVLVNLERMRWMPRDLGERYLFVNIPDFTVKLVRGRPGGLAVEGGGRQDQGDRDPGILRRGELPRGQSDLAHPELDRDPRLPAEAAEGPDGAEAAEHPPADPGGD